MGTYRWIRASYYVVLARRLELEPRKEEFENHAAFTEAVRQRPEELLIRARLLTEAPQGWSAEKCGIFPPSGIMIVYCTLPSAHRSASSRYVIERRLYTDTLLQSMNSYRQFDKHTMLAFCKPEEANNLLGLQDELTALFGWKCYTHP